MDMNQFRSHLISIQGKLGVPQNQLWEQDVKTRQASLSEAISGVVLTENARLAPKGKGGKAAKNLYQEEEYTAENVLAEYLAAYFGDTLTEDTSEDEIVEAIEHLNIICANLYEFLNSEGEEPNDVVKEALDSIFENGDLREDSSDEEVMEAIDNLFHVAATINEYLAA